MNHPLRHISIRVPWHDTGWDGRVCAAPRLNGACLILKRLAEERDDAAEEADAGKRLDELPQAEWPACVAERMSFMALFEVLPRDLEDWKLVSALLGERQTLRAEGKRRAYRDAQATLGFLEEP